jgi:predicted RNA-binding Zn-ribbon protein involved in translation (DUF1610 family)
MESEPTYCEADCRLSTPELVELTWEHPEPGRGILRCPRCGHIAAAYYCPYIPNCL